MRHTLVAALALLFLLLSPTARAQDIEAIPDIPLEVLDSSEGPPPDGWNFKLGPSVTFSFTDNRNVVNQQDGYTLNLGLKFHVDIVMIRKPHEWRTAFRLAQTLSRTPIIDEFYLSEDILELESIYLFYLVEWFGFYGRAVLNTQVFPGYDYRSSAVTYFITHRDGTTQAIKNNRLRLSDAFEPLTLKQGLGPFFRPLRKEKVNIEILLGMGFHETFLGGLRAVDDDSATPRIEVRILEDIYQIGGEGVARLWGELWDKKLSYSVWIETMAPFYTKPDIGLRGGDIVNVEAGTRWSVRFFEWMSLDYEFKVVRQAQILEKWQIYNNILFNLSYGWNHFIAWDEGAVEAEGLPATSPAEDVESEPQPMQ